MTTAFGMTSSPLTKAELLLLLALGIFKLLSHYIGVRDA